MTISGSQDRCDVTDINMENGQPFPEALCIGTSCHDGLVKSGIDDGEDMIN